MVEITVVRGHNRAARCPRRRVVDRRPCGAIPNRIRVHNLQKRLRNMLYKWKLQKFYKNFVVQHTFPILQTTSGTPGRPVRFYYERLVFLQRFLAGIFCSSHFSVVTTGKKSSQNCCKFFVVSIFKACFEDVFVGCGP